MAISHTSRKEPTARKMNAEAPSSRIQGHATAWLKLLFVFIVCQVSVVQSLIVHRSNYGVVFKKVAEATNGEQMWRHTFHLVLPNGTSLDPIKFQCDDQREFKMCNRFKDTLEHIDKIRVQSKTNLENVIASIKNIIPESSLDSRAGRRHRSLLPFIGDLSSTLFGTAKQADVDALKHAMQAVIRKQSQMIHAFQGNSFLMSSFMSAVNFRLQTAMNAIRLNNNVLKSTFTSLQNIIDSNSRAENTLLRSLSYQIRTSSNIAHHVSNLEMGIHDLVEGKLSSFLVPAHDIMKLLKHVQAYLLKNHPQFGISHQNVDFYYKEGVTQYSRVNSSIFFTINIPITQRRHKFKIFKVITFPVPLNQSTSHGTFLKPEFPYLAIEKHGKHFIQLSESDVAHCLGARKVCKLQVPQQIVQKPTCLSAIFLQQTAYVSKECDFRFKSQSISPKVIYLSKHEILLSNISSLSLSCNSTLKREPGCMFCIVKLPCFCSVKANDYFIPPRLSECLQDTEKVSKLYPVNLALLHNFFEIDQLHNILGDSTLDTYWNISIPNFTLFDHHFKKLIANDKVAELSLKRIAEKAKNNEIVYQSLSDPILNGDLFSVNTWNSPSGYIAMSALCLCFILGIFLLLTMFKLRKLTMAVMILQATKQASASPLSQAPYLVWNPPTSALAATEPPALLAMFENSFWHSLLCSFILICFLVISCIILSRYFYRKHTVLFLEISNGQMCVKIPLLQLAFCPKYCRITSTDNPEVLNLHGSLFKPMLKLNWNNLEIQYKLTNQTVTIPKDIKIGYITKLKLRKILDTPFAAYLIIIHNNNTEYVETEINGTESNIDIKKPSAPAIYPEVDKL